MWHAQNKLSLTVFRAYAVAPGKAGYKVEIYILIISEILDHDAQIACMLLNKTIGLVKSHPKVDWSKVKRLHIASDCGPHFHSYENAAHFLWTLVFRLALKLVTLMRFSYFPPLPLRCYNSPLLLCPRLRNFNFLSQFSTWLNSTEKGHAIACLDGLVHGLTTTFKTNQFSTSPTWKHATSKAQQTCSEKIHTDLQF